MRSPIFWGNPSARRFFPSARVTGRGWAARQLIKLPPQSLCTADEEVGYLIS